MVIAGIIFLILLLPLLFRNHLVVEDPLHKAEAIVVLGAPAKRDGSIGLVARRRMEAGIQLFKDGFAPILIVSGGAVRNAFSEAGSMKDYALTRGIPDSALVVEDQARDTFGNLGYVKEILTARGWKSILLVTSAYHSRRVALLNERYFQIEAVIHPVKAPGGLKWHHLLHTIYSEYVLIFFTKFIRHRDFKEAK